MTGPGADAWCTFHMHSAPTATATTATNGSHTLASTVLPTERGLTRSPLETRYQTSCFSLDLRCSCTVGEARCISTRLIYNRRNATSIGPGRELGACAR